MDRHVSTRRAHRGPITTGVAVGMTVAVLVVTDVAAFRFVVMRAALVRSCAPTKVRVTTTKAVGVSPLPEAVPGEAVAEASRFRDELYACPTVRPGGSRRWPLRRCPWPWPSPGAGSVKRSTSSS